jgi:hypothetical protein
VNRSGTFLLMLALGLSPAALFAQEAPPTPTAAPSPEPTPTVPETPEAPPPEPEPLAAPVTAAAASANPTYFNPAMAVIGNFLATAGRNPVEDRPSLEMHESEISLQAIVDPYARADFFISLSNEGIELEEGFITFTHLPADFLVKVGKFKAQFGKVNTLHPHVLPWADVPLPLVNLLGGEEGWNDAGVSVARLFALPGDTFSELTLQVFRGESENLFAASRKNDVAYLGQYRVYRDIGDDHNVEVGATWGRGHNGVTEDSETTLENVHLVYRWRPLSGTRYRTFILRSELIRSRREQEDGKQTGTGFFVGGDYRFAQRWWAGGRYEFSDHADDATQRDKGGAITLTFWPSEFSQIRGELRQRKYAGGIKANEAFLQFQFSIGAHGAHPF